MSSNKNLYKRLKALKNLPLPDKYQALKDFHTVNAIGFFGKALILRVFEAKGKVRLGDYVKEGEFINPDDKDLQFESGFVAVRKYFRNLAKPVGLALMYGGTEKVLEDKLKLAKSSALKLFINFFKTLKVLKAHLDKRLKDAEKNGYVKNLFDTKLFLPQLKDRRLYYQGKNKVYNSPIQNTASFLIKLAILKSSNWIEKYSLNRYIPNNIAKIKKGGLYSRIVVVDSKYLKELKREDFKKGHTKLLIVDKKGEVVKESAYNVKLDRYRFEKYKMRVEF